MILLRPLRIWWLALALVLGLWWDAQSWTYLGGVSDERQRRRQVRRARWLTDEFLALGSAFIKLGQLLSARPDVLPAELVEQLAVREGKRVTAYLRDMVYAALEKAVPGSEYRAAEAADHAAWADSVKRRVQGRMRTKQPEADSNIDS